MPRPPAGPICRTLVAGVGAGLLATSLFGGTANAEPPATPSGQPNLITTPATPLTAGRYVVTLLDPPAATYAGGVAGIQATESAPGEQMDASSAEVQAYSDHLEQVQRDVAATAGVTPDTSYTLALNAFAADLTAAQAQKLAATRGVMAVSPDEMMHVDTDTTPGFLGLEGPNGVWAQHGGVDAAGDGVVVGVIDSGITPESASFAGEALGTTATDDGTPYLDGDAIVQDKNDGTQFRGECETTEDFTADLCTTKIVGARYYADGFLGADGTIDDLSPYEFISPRDGGGHGTHTASTAAGNHGVTAEIDGQELGQVSGMAPAATIAAYKVCWDGPDETVTTDDGCTTSDILAAIDDAILDGVDVINFSIGGGTQVDVAEPIEFAFLSAASAGIFVAASAGNSGPGASTLDHASPWLTTVAASTELPEYGTAVLGDGSELLGISTSVRETTGPAPLVQAADVALPGAPADVALCPADSLDPAQVAGTIVVCDRGVYDRVAKSAEVARAGGIGMILVNPTENSLDADLHSVPTVHVGEEHFAALHAYAATEGATATLEPGNTTDESFPYPQTAGFSSRGPAVAGGGDVLKPDISAPGVGILAAVAPQAAGGDEFGYYSGTSMSSPHIAGLAALYFGVHPDWSPMMVKSAMMTTAYDLQDAEGATTTDPFAAGAGHVDPTRFFNPGLVYDASDEDWLSYIEGTGFDTGIDGIEPIDPSDLNQPSVAIGALTGTQTVTRTVTAVTPGLYRATASIPGVDVRVTPSILSFTAAGQEKTFKITFTTNSSAELGAYTNGFLTWQGGRTQVRSPLVVKPVAVDAPGEVSGSGAEGSIDVPVTGGFTGDLDVTTAGLAAGDVTEDAVADGDFAYYPVTLPADTSLARIDLDALDDTVDLDLALYQLDDTGTPVAIAGTSATGSADERIDLLAPEAGDYLVEVAGYSTNGPSADFVLTTFAVTPETVEGSPTVSPNPVPVTIGRPTSFTYSWSGLDAATPYLGWLGYEGTEDVTVVSIN